MRASLLVAISRDRSMLTKVFVVTDLNDHDKTFEGKDILLVLSGERCGRFVCQSPGK